MAVVREHSTISTWLPGVLQDAHVPWSGDPGRETRATPVSQSYLERGHASVWLPASPVYERSADNEMRCIERSTATPGGCNHCFNFVTAGASPSMKALGQRSFLHIVALDRALDREHFTSVVGADQRRCRIFGGRAA